MMMRPVLVGLLLIAGAASATKIDCEPSRCAAQAAIAQECPCEGASNHGQYVSCVAHVVRRLAASGEVAVNCKGKVTRCGARSTCGKPGFVTCQIPVSECVIAAGATTGLCANDQAIVCTGALDCGARCKVKSTDIGCLEAGGFVGQATSCCAGPSCGM
jgi:hypothetical protein